MRLVGLGVIAVRRGGGVAWRKTGGAVKPIREGEGDIEVALAHVARVVVKPMVNHSCFEAWDSASPVIVGEVHRKVNALVSEVIEYSRRDVE